MQVCLRSNWFAPNGFRYRKSADPKVGTEVPDEFHDRLPPTAVILDGTAAPKPKAVEAVETLASHDGERAATDAEAAALEAAQKTLDAAKKAAEGQGGVGTQVSRDTAEVPVPRRRARKAA